MIISKMFKFILSIFFLFFLTNAQTFAIEDFDKWIKNFQVKAVKYGISEKVVNEIMSEARFLPKVIEYDRYQPELKKDLLTEK